MVKCQQVKFSGHAIQRMFERKISKSDVISIIASGETIAEYPDDNPYPSLLLFGFINERPVHIVVAVDQATGTCYVVTSYIPVPEQWADDYKTRR